MKKSILLHTAIGMGIALTIPLTSCQIIHDFTASDSGIKKVIVSNNNSVMTANTGKEYVNAISIKVVRSFVKHFEDVKNVSWLKTMNGGYVAQFNIDSVQTSVAYSNNGLWNYILRRYAENHMPPKLLRITKGVFPDYAILEVTEIKLPNEINPIYRIMIKKEDNIKILRIFNGEMEIIGDYTKPV